MPADRTSAEKAVAHVLHRMRRDGRLAYLIGPGSEAYDLLTQAHADALGEDVTQFRATFSAQLQNPVTAGLDRTTPGAIGQP